MKVDGGTNNGINHIKRITTNSDREKSKVTSPAEYHSWNYLWASYRIAIAQFDARHVVKILNHVGTSSTVEVQVEGNPEPYLAIFRDTQIDIIRRSLIHVDLQALSLTETVRVPVSVILTGVSPAIELGGVLVQILNELEIEALAQRP